MSRFSGIQNGPLQRALLDMCDMVEYEDATYEELCIRLKRGFVEQELLEQELVDFLHKDK